MYLLDTNIWLERLLNQDRSSDVGRFLSKKNLNTFFNFSHVPFKVHVHLNQIHLI